MSVAACRTQSAQNSAGACRLLPASMQPANLAFVDQPHPSGESFRMPPGSLPAIATFAGDLDAVARNLTG